MGSTEKHSFHLPPSNAAADKQNPLLEINPVSGGISSVRKRKQDEKLEPWEAVLQDYMEANNADLHTRCLHKTLTPSDINAIMEALEMSGKDAITLDVFASFLRLTEPEIVELIRKYPDTLGRSLKIAQANRKNFILDAVKTQAFRNSAAFKELLTSPNFKNVFEAADELDEQGSVAQKAERMLQEKGIMPDKYATAIFLTGDVRVRPCPRNRVKRKFWFYLSK